MLQLAITAHVQVADEVVFLCQLRSPGRRQPPPGTGARESARHLADNPPSQWLVEAPQLIEADQHVDEDGEEKDQALQRGTRMLYHQPLYKPNEAHRPSQADGCHFQKRARPGAHGCASTNLSAMLLRDLDPHGAL